MDKEKTNPKEYFYLRKYNRYLDKTIIVIVIAVILLAIALVFLWVYYLPEKKSNALKINFIDGSNPSTTGKGGVNVGQGNNLQNPGNNDTGVTKNNDPLGNYQKAQLKQFCSLTDTSNAINLPSNFKYQQCDTGLKCTSGILKQGPICLADIGSNCNNLSDCVPNTDACLQGKCTVINFDNKINTTCDSDIDCQTNQFEDQFNNHVCFKLPGENKGICKVDLYPFDGGCKTDTDCVFISGHVITCVNNNNFLDTFFGASIVSQRKFNEPYEGISLTIELDVNFNLNILNTSDNNFMLNMVFFDADGNINASDPPKPFTIPDEGVCIINNQIKLNPLEFFSDGYPSSYEGITGVSVYFGDKQPDSNFVGRDKTTGGPYGICLDLLPIGSPADLKIGNITIPAITGVSGIQTAIADNRIINQSRIGFNNGKIGDFCFNKPGASPILGCGLTQYLGITSNLECGYNYKFEEILLDNFNYVLNPEPFEIEYVGTCMIKNARQFQSCDNITVGCIDPNVCLPILDPVTNQKSNYCVAVMRSQFCENNICPANYTCQGGVSCLSNKDNLAITSSDCLSGNIANNTPVLYVFNKDNQKYYNLNLNIESYINPNDNMNNLTFKMGTCYQIIDNYNSIGIENKSYLPKNLLVYGAPQTDGSIKGVIYQLNNNQYSYYNNFNITPSTNNTIEDISLVNDENLAVVQKRTIQELREIAFPVNYIFKNTQDLNQIYFFLDQTSYWFNFNMLIPGETYQFYLYQEGSSEYNYKLNGQFDISVVNKPIGTQDFYLESFIVNINDYSGPIPGQTTKINNLFLVINTNKLSFNNNTYFKNYQKNNLSENELGFSPFDNPVSKKQQLFLPADYLGLIENKKLSYSSQNFGPFGENFFMSPKVYSNNNTVLNPNFVKNYSHLRNGDRLRILDDFVLYNIISFQVDQLEDFFENITEIGISSNTYLYTELVQPNKYFNDVSKSYIPLNNYICNLHKDYLTSQGGVASFDNSKAVYNQNFGYNSQDDTLPVKFTVFDDMVNYNINFIPLTSNNNTYTIQDQNSIIGVSNNNGKLYIGNGINNSFSYNFESDTKVNFNFDQSNNVLITSQVEGMSGFYTYLQKVNYQVDINPLQSSISDPDYREFNLFNETNFEKFYQYSYSQNGNNYLGNIKFKYSKELVVPNAKSLYFDSTIKSNLIDKVEENLMNAGDNNISLFTTFKNDSFIKEDGNVEESVLDINSQNIYSNKAPPIGAYSTLNDFDISVSENNNVNEINFSFTGFTNNNQYSYVELNNGISLNYTLEKNCVNDNTNFITIRDPEIIEVFLNNPASEIVLQKNGSTMDQFYCQKLREGASIAAVQLKDKNGKSNYNSESNNFLNDKYYLPKYDNSTSFFKEKTIEFNRSIVAIDEYNIYVDKNNNIQELLVVKLNAGISINDPYVIDCFTNVSNWKLWHNNYVELTYYNQMDYSFYTSSNDLSTINIISSPNSENLTVILDGSALWSSTKGNNYDLTPENFSTSSFNKILINQDGNFDIFNVHDDYFFKKSLTTGSNDINTLIDGLSTLYDLESLIDVVPFESIDNPYFELPYEANTVSATIISTPGLRTSLDTSSLPNLPNTFISQAGISIIDQPTDNNIISFLTGEGDIRPIRWITDAAFKIFVDQDSFENYFFQKSLPKKIKVFNINSNIDIYTIFMPINKNTTINNNYFVKNLNNDLTNDSFVYFKRKYTENFLITQYQKIFTNSTYFNNFSNFNVLNLIGNNSSDKIYSIDDYSGFETQTDTFYPAGVNLESVSGNDNRHYWIPLPDLIFPNLQYGLTVIVPNIVVEYVFMDASGTIQYKSLSLSYDAGIIPDEYIPSSLDDNNPQSQTLNNFLFTDGDLSKPKFKPYPTLTKQPKITSSNQVVTYNITPLTKYFSYDPTKELGEVTFQQGLNVKYNPVGIGIRRIWGNFLNFDSGSTTFEYKGPGYLYFKFTNKDNKGNYRPTNINFYFDLSENLPVFSSNECNLTVANTRTSAPSFQREVKEYDNSFRPIYYTNTDPSLNYKNMYAINYIKNGYYDMMLLSIEVSEQITQDYNIVGKLEMRPQYSSSICLPDNYNNYNNKIYMINNLFLSSLNSKHLTNFEYVKLALVENFFIANKYYITNFADSNEFETKYKGLGNIEFKLTSAPVIKQNQDISNDFNLVNFQEIRFPKWFTERFVSRFNSIPKIKSIFTTIKQGNIFNNMVYYAYLSYSTIEDSNTASENDQLLYMTTDVDQKTVLENRGVPYTMSLSLDEITVEQLQRLVQFEPYNKFIFTLGYACL